MPKSKNSPASLSALRVPYLPHMRPAGPFGLAGAFPTLGARACRSDAKIGHGACHRDPTGPTGPVPAPEMAF